MTDADDPGAIAPFANPAHMNRSMTVFEGVYLALQLSDTINQVRAMISSNTDAERTAARDRVLDLQEELLLMTARLLEGRPINDHVRG